MYAVSKEKPFYVTLSVLNVLFCVPKSLEKSFRKKFLIAFFVIKILNCIVFIGLPCYHLIAVIKGNNGIDVSTDISFMMGGGGASITTIFFTLRYKQWSSFFIDLENCNCRFGKPLRLDKSKKQLNLYSTVFVAYIFCGILLQTMITSFDTSCKKINEEYGLHEICGTPLPIKLPFEVDGAFARVVIIVVQIASLSSDLPTGAIINFLVYESTEIIILHIQSLKNHFEKVFDVSDEELVRKRLRFCIYYHIHILSLIKRLNRLVRYSVGHMSLICAILFGCFGNQLLSSSPLPGMLFLIGYMVSLFLICHAGQRMLDETSSICDAVYNSKWYEADAKIMKDIRFIIARSQISEGLDALPLGSLNYPLFLMIIKTSYSYLTLLQQSI